MSVQLCSKELFHYVADARVAPIMTGFRHAVLAGRTHRNRWQLNM